VPDVAVILTPKPRRWPEVRGVTSVDGRYEITVSTPGEYTASVLSRGAAYDAGSVNVSSSTTYDIDMRGGSLQGRVIEALSRAPVSGVTVFLSRPNDRGQTFPITTDSDGRFSFDTVAPGTYELRASKPRYVSATQTVEVSEGARELEITLERGERLVLRVVEDPSGQPVDRVSVSVRDAAKKAVYSGGPAYDDSGAMSVSLAPGQYKVTVTAYGYGWQTVDATVPGPELVVRIARAGRVVVQGRVPGAVGLRLASTNSPVKIGNQVPPATFENVPSGTYNLEVTGAKGVVLKSKPVVVTPGATTTVVLE
jgi:hypothetical protein